MTPVRRAALGGGLLLFALLLAPGDASAQAHGVPADASAAAGWESPWVWELDFAYGRGVDISAEKTYVGDVRFFGLTPRVGRAVGEVFNEGTWHEGRVRLLVEVPFLVSMQPQPGYAVGSTLLARYTLVAPDRWRPFAELGAGPVYLGFNNHQNQADGLSFTLQGGVGVTYPVASGWAVVPRVHFHHISNAGLRSPNPGINDLLFTIGFARHAP